MKKSLVFFGGVLGILLGALCTLSPGSVFMLAAAGLTYGIIARSGPGRARRFLARLFLAGFLVRVFLSVSLDLVSWRIEGSLPRKTAPAIQDWNVGMEDRSRAYLRLGDSDYYSQRAYAISEFVRGSREPVVLYRLQEYGWNWYPFMMGWFYFTFGFSPIAVKWLNAWIGAMLALAIYGMARQLFENEGVARWAGRLAAFFPSMIFWAATNLKEPLLFLSTAGLFIIGIRLQSERALWKFWVGLIPLAVLFRVHLGIGRPEASWTLLVCWAATLVWSRFVLRWRRGLVVAGLIFLLASPFLPWKPLSEIHRQGVLRHLSYAQGTGMIYHYLPEKFYHLQEGSAGNFPWSELSMPGFLIYLPRAFFHYFLEPLPSRMADWLSVAAMPQMIVWTLLLPFMGGGMAWSLRGPRKECALFPLVTLLGWTLMGTLSMANVGTLFRIRDMITPFLLLYAAAGLWMFLFGKREVERDVPG